MKKYEMIPDDNGLYRIKALRDFGTVEAGELGGLIEKEENLDHYGNCWVYIDAKVYGNARVCDNAVVSGDAQVYGNAKVYTDTEVSGDAQVYGNAKVYDNAQVYGDARVYDNAQVYDNAHVYGIARVCDSARVYGNARVFGNTKVFDNARVCGNTKVYGIAKVRGNTKVYGNARVCGDAYIKSTKDYITLSPVGRENEILTAFRSKEGLSVNRGCFTGTLEEFAQAVKKTHGNNKCGVQYDRIIEFLKTYF